MRKVPETLTSIESLEQVDPPARTLQRWLRRRLPEGTLSRALGGAWFGHPLHPILVLVPVGTWVSVGVLDVMPRQQEAARRLVLAGLVAAVPSIVAGAADYRELDERGRRVGFVHLLSNLTATGCYAASYLMRSRGRHLGGKAWAMLGLAAVGAGGALGGHLTYAQGAGVFRWQAPPRADEPAMALTGTGARGRGH